MEKLSVDSTSVIISKMIHELFGKTINEQSWDLDFLSSEIGLNGTDLVYLYFEIREYFGVDIPQAFISKGDFRSINSVANIVVSHSNKEKLIG